MFCIWNNTTQDGTENFSIEWYTSDTTVSIDYFQKGVVDVGITYHAVAEHTAIVSKIADRVEYVWRDHWMLVGMTTLSYICVVVTFSSLFPTQVLSLDDQAGH